MTSPDGSLAERWRRFFEEAIGDDVRAFVEAYPEDRSLYVDVFDLHRWDDGFVDSLFASPDRSLRVGAETLRGAHESLGRVNLRLRNLPSQLSLGAVRVRHRAKLISVDGEVDAVGPIEAAASVAAFSCAACGETTAHRQRGIELAEPLACEACGELGTMELDRDRSRFVDVQRVVLTPGSGDDDRTMPIYLDDDLVETVDVGESLRVTGIVRLDPRPGENRFRLYLDGLTVEEQTAAGALEEAVEVDEAVKDTIRARWGDVVGR